MAIRLVLVDDQPAVRQGLRMRLSLEPDILIVGEAGDGESSLALVDGLRPDVVLMDIMMPRMDGIAATKALRQAVPECAVVILSLHDDLVTRQRARAAGAFACIAKQELDKLLLEAIRQAAHMERA
ncbi:MAG: hypothetical protein KatS3mg057_3047 [Herpetosiphonaceae bacterium]|nr:MAG: hypothetical protein KatS3mg057_3047 [Herpetosiphonaceae bacterium]